MKTKSLALVTAAIRIKKHAVCVPRFQIFRQSRAGNFMAELNTDSPTEAVEMFTIMSPTFEGGEIRIWDDREQRVCAAVTWQREVTEFGFMVHQRQNVFKDPMLAVLARRQAERETLRESILSSIRQTISLGTASHSASV